MFYIEENDKLTLERVEKYIEVFKSRHLPRLKRLKRYYDGKNDKIMNRTFKDTTKANNKIATPWVKYITEITASYFIGKPVTYNSLNEVLLAELSNIFEYNDEVQKNQQLAIDASIYGVAYEIVYLHGQDKNIRFSTLSPETVIPIYSTAITEDLLYAIRFYTTTDILTSEETTIIEVYSDHDITTYKSTLNGTVHVSTIPHFFKEVPINVYRNNPECTGDSERLIPLIDGYDISLSDTANSRAELINSYLVFRNCNLDQDDILAMKEKRIICIEDSQEGSQSSVDWLNRDSNDTENQNYTQRLEDDILKFSGIGALEQKSHTTALGARLAMLGLEENVGIKENYFKYALIRRIEIICNILNTLGADYRATEVSMNFVRNLPVDTATTADMISKLQGLVSKETLLAQLPFVSNVQDELTKVEKENEINSYPNFMSEVGE